MPPRLFVFFATVLALIAMGAANDEPSYINYTTVTGFFLQDDPKTVSSTFDYVYSNPINAKSIKANSSFQTATNFGLINQTYDTDGEYDPEHKKTQWQRFEHKVFRLNRHSGRNVQYKVLYMGRHGEGYHNAAESFYGTPLWNVRKAMAPGIERETDGDRLDSATGQKRMATALSPGLTRI